MNGTLENDQRSERNVRAGGAGGTARECGLTANYSYREKSPEPFRMIRRLRLARAFEFRDGARGISSMCAVETRRARNPVG